MGKTLIEIFEGVGLDVLHNLDDASWLLDRIDEFSELIEECSSLLEVGENEQS